MQIQQNLERIKSFHGCRELSTPEREELQRLRESTVAPIKTFKGHSMKPFPCTFAINQLYKFAEMPGSPIRTTRTW